MSSSLISALSGGEEAAFQEQLKRQFRENLSKNPDQMAAYNKAVNDETPWYSPSSLRAMENERQAAARRANQMASGAQAIRETAIAQGRNVAVSPEGRIQISDPDPSKAIGRFAVRPSGLMQSQVEELPGGFKAVYDREGRLVGTNVPFEVPSDPATKSPGPFMDAIDRAAFNRGDSTAAERAALYPAMEAAVRQQRKVVPPQPEVPSVPAPPAASTNTIRESMAEGLPPNWLYQPEPPDPLKSIEDLVRERGGLRGAMGQMDLSEMLRPSLRDQGYLPPDEASIRRGIEDANKLYEWEQNVLRDQQERIRNTPKEPLPPDVAALLVGKEPFSQAARRQQRNNTVRARAQAVRKERDDDEARAKMSRKLDQIFNDGKSSSTPPPENKIAASLMGRGLLPEAKEGMLSTIFGLGDLMTNYLGRPLDRLLFGIPIPEQPSQMMEEYQRSVGRPAGWTGF